jgi:uncharacterized membrane protein (DUF485 family)
MDTQTKAQVLESAGFRRLVARRWRVSLVLTMGLFVLYYGYIVLIAINKPFLAVRIGGGITPIGVPLGAAVIVGSWVLTAAYIAWANRYYDPEVDSLRRTLSGRR